MRLLVIEDEHRLAENVATAFKEGPGYAVDINRFYRGDRSRARTTGGT